MPASVALSLLLERFSITYAKAGLPLKLEFERIDGADCKISGSLLATNVVMLLWVCWTILWDSKISRSLRGKRNLCLPDVRHLVLSAGVSCVEDSGGSNL